ncbi:MAG: TonB-dependent receptor [candidate division WOR-3 bacterium]|nr:MAG: TonB-dependent receptor [candidate division WOR-3 bacterium]
MRSILCIFTACGLLLAGDFGRITGRIVDRETGNPLAGADVMVTGTECGAATDENGAYAVLYVPVGTYAISASYIGYTPYEYISVVVHADQITRLNFRLSPAVIEVGGITSVAERPMIIVSETSTSRAVTADEMKRLPATTLDEIVGLQPGVVQSYRGTHVRGGRPDEVMYYVDGIIAREPYYGQQSAILSYSTVEEITMVSGGFDAEYGDALSGIVNIATKEGGIKHTGALHYYTDEIFSGHDRVHYGYNRYEFSLGGPTLLASRIRYFLSGELMLTDAYQEARYKVPSPRMDYRAQARLSYLLPNAKGKITLSGFNERRQWIYWDRYTDDPNTAKYSDSKPMNRIKNWMASGKVNYMITPKTLVSLNAGITHYERALGARDYAWEDSAGRQWYDDYRLKAEHLIDYILDGTLPVRDVLVDSVLQYHIEPDNTGILALRHSPYGMDGWFFTYGDYNRWFYRQNDDYQMRFDLTHSSGKVHELKTGLDFVRYRCIFPYRGSMRIIESWDYYDKRPYKIASFIQDKMDFGGLIARLGVRFDYFDPKAFTYAAPTDWENDSILRSKINHTISPRIGISLPVTDRMKFRFNYGHYFQFPYFDPYYLWTDTIAPVRIQVYRGNFIGNITLEPQRTVMYEIGLETLLTDDVAFGFTAYFKDIYDLLQIREVLAIPSSYIHYVNVDYGNVKGFEINLNKQMSNMWALGINYTLQFAKGTAADATEWWYDNWYYGTSVPVIDHWLDFDERHSIHANIDVELPGNFFFVPLQDFLSSIVIAFHSGFPYTPRDLRGNLLGEENSARMPGFWNVDLRLRRRFSIGPIDLVLNGIIYNLFNTEQVLYVYSTTGKPDDHGDPEPPLDQFGNVSISSYYYSPQADHSHDGLITPIEYKQEWIDMLADYYENPVYYNHGFRAQVGIGIEF